MAPGAHMTDSRVYAALDELLAAAGVPISLAELHGGMCGAACVGGADAARAWVRHSLADNGADPAVVERLQQEFAVLAGNLSGALADFQLGFEPYLPGEDEPLEMRTRALASWCQGFLAGLGLAGSSRAGAILRGTGDAAEIVRDFAEIGKATVGEEEPGDEQQAGFAFAEIVEYVRVGVQIVHEELAAARRAPAPAAARRVAH